MTARKHWFRVADSVLWEPWTDRQLATLVRLAAYLNTRWARNGLAPEEAGTALLNEAALRAITRRAHFDSALVSLRNLSEMVSISVRNEGKTVAISWPKFAEFQEFRNRTPAPPTPAPAPREEKKKKREPRGFSEAPAQLGQDERDALFAWAQRNYPEVSRARLGQLAAACLDWHRTRGRRAKDWSAAIRNWVRREMRPPPMPSGGPSLSRRLEGQGRANRESAESLAQVLGHLGVSADGR